MCESDCGGCTCGETEPVETNWLGHFIEKQRAFSEKTYGPGVRTEGVLKHISKELKEIEADPYDLTEWVDVLLLTLDGTWRHGFDPHEVGKAMERKLEINKARNWPDWRLAPLGESIHHVKEAA